MGYKLTFNNFYLKNRAKNLNSKKFLFTPGPASLTANNLMGIGPAFGRGDDQYLKIESVVLDWLRVISGQSQIVRLQGSATLAIEVALRNFVSGKVLVLDSGYYSKRITDMLSHRSDVSLFVFDKADNYGDYIKFDWVVACPTETSTAYLTPINSLKDIAEKYKAKLFLDATGSIGLEENHNLADVVCFSSCKGLFGLTGASFIAFSVEPSNTPKEFSLSLSTYAEKKTTGPYNAIQSLFANIPNFSALKNSVIVNKSKMLELTGDKLVHSIANQPKLCTAVASKIVALDPRVVLYNPRVHNNYSIICHLGEAHLGYRAQGKILKKISFSTFMILK